MPKIGKGFVPSKLPEFGKLISAKHFSGWLLGPAGSAHIRLEIIDGPQQPLPY
jgi:hypothetical protein